jgi:ubiquinone biosynthesis protein
MAQSAVSRHNLKRYREIMSVLTKNGLGFLFVKTALSRNPQKELNSENTKPGTRTIAERIRLSCEQLGPTFVKLGQIVGTRTDIVPEGIAKELQKLQDDVPPFPFAVAREMIESELGDEIESIYLEFDTEPVASASVSQVYRARLRTGDLVAVKVPRPDTREKVKTDLGILLILARFLDRHTKYGKLYDFEGMVRELQKVMEQEMNFLHEGSNIDRFRENLAGQENITAPRVRWTYTTERVLTMDYVEGVKINDIAALDKMGADKKKIARDFADSLLRQILADGFFHADPHPGNVMVTHHGARIEYIDLGMAGQLSEHFRMQLGEMMTGIALQNTRKIAKAIMDMDIANANVNQRHFLKTLDTLMDEYVYSPITNFDIGKMFSSIFSLAGRYNMVIQKEFALVAKALGTAQSIIEQLAPDTSVLSIAKETTRKWTKGFSSANRFENDLLTAATDTSDLARALPAFLLSLMRKAEENDFGVDINLKQLERFDKHLERMANRISFAVVLLAVCIVMAGVIIAVGFRAGSEPDLYDISIFALRAGLVIAVVIVGGLVFSMIYSNIKRRR